MARTARVVSILHFSHLDLSWLGTQAECLSRSNHVIGIAMREAESDPGYRFYLDYMIFVDHFLRCHPEAEERLRRLVRTGQLELAPLWTGLHSDFQPGENMVRNILYAKRYIGERFGVDAGTVMMTDIPGHAKQLPQILSKTGIDFHVMTRMGPKDVRLFHWRSPDGSRVLTWNDHPAWNPYGGYGWSMYRGIDESVAEMRRLGFEEELLTDFSCCAVERYLIQAGNDLMRPFPDMRRIIAEWNGQSEISLALTTLAEYRDAIMGDPGIPEREGEIPSTWAYLEAAYAPMFQYEQRATAALTAAEKWSVVAAQLGYLPHYPAETLREAWKGLLVAQDHNYSGQGAREGQRRKLSERLRAVQVGEELQREALMPLAENVKAPSGRCVPIVVFNGSGATRTDTVTAHYSWQWQKMDQRWETIGKEDAFALLDDQGTPVAIQVLEDFRRQTREIEFVFTAREVPALGYRTYYLVPCEAAPEHPVSSTVMPLDRVMQRQGADNRWFRLELDAAAGTFSVFDKQLRRHVVQGAHLVSREQRFHPENFSADGTTGRDWSCRITKVSVVESGPVRTVLALDLACTNPNAGPCRLELTLYEDLHRMDIDCHTEMLQPDMSRLELVLPTGIRQPAVRFAVPYGTSCLTDLMEEAGPRPEYEGPVLEREVWASLRQVQGWLDVADQDWGMSMASSRQLVRFDDGTARCVLQRFTPYCRGPILSRFALLPHGGSWQEARTYRMAYDFQDPLVAVVSYDPEPEKALPPRQSFLEGVPEHAVLGVLKQAEMGEGFVVRIVEMEGRTSRVTLGGPLVKRLAIPASLLETADETGDDVLSPYAIQTWLL